MVEMIFTKVTGMPSSLTSIFFQQTKLFWFWWFLKKAN